MFGFFATIVFAIDFYLIFNDVAKFLKQEDSAQETTADKAEGGWPPVGSTREPGPSPGMVTAGTLPSLAGSWLV